MLSLCSLTILNHTYIAHSYSLFREVLGNAAMDLDHKEPTYPCSPELMGNTFQQEMSTGRGGNYINATMSQRYLNSNFADHLPAANYPPRLISNVRLAKYCLQLTHIERY